MKDDDELLAARFEEQRTHLRAVAYRMLGSVTEADDAVQEAWLRLSRTDTSEVANLAGWLTTVVGRVCLDMLRSRRSRREEPLLLPEPVPERAGSAAAGPGYDPEEQALLADSVGLALLVVLENLDPAERLAFVLHDMFAVPFDDIARVLDRSPAAARQLASRARRRVQGGSAAPEPDLVRQREIVEAFLAAARHGDFDALLAVLDPDVVNRSGGPEAVQVVRGAASVARNAAAAAAMAGVSQLALIDGSVGVISAQGTHGYRVLRFAFRGGRISEMEVVTDPERLRRLDVELLD